VFRGVQAFPYPFGVKINVYGATIRPNFFVLSFFIVFLSFLLVSLFLFFSSYLSSYSSLLIYLYYLGVAMSPKDWCVHGTGAHARPKPTSNCVDFAVENPRKMKEKPHKNWPRLEEVTTAIEKNPGKGPPAIVFFLQRKYLDSIREHSELLSR
jgi:hypothetical protein